MLMLIIRQNMRLAHAHVRDIITKKKPSSKLYGSLVWV
jgi:hypothetical protein